MNFRSEETKVGWMTFDLYSYEISRPYFVSMIILVRIIFFLGDYSNFELKPILFLLLPPVKFHDLRATFITQMLLKGVPLAKVMIIVGHATIKTTMRYLRLVAQDTHGATESLGITLPKDFETGNVINLFQNYRCPYPKLTKQ